MKQDLGIGMGPLLDRRKFMLGATFTAAAGVGALRQPTRHLDFLGTGKLEDIVPRTIGSWKFISTSGIIVPPKDQLADALYSQLLTRAYSNGQDAPIMLVVAQSSGQTGILQIHRPEVCYPASGYQLSPVTPRLVPTNSTPLPANSLTATADGVSEHILYWTRVGDAVPTSWRDQRLAVALQNLRGIIPDAVLIRVSTRRNDAAGAYAAMENFVQTMLATVPAKMRSVFVA